MISQKKSAGFFITDDKVLFVSLVRNKKGVELGEWGEISIPAGVIKDGAVKNSNELKKVFIGIKKKYNFKSITVSCFPDQIFVADLLRESGFKKVIFESVGEALSRIVENSNNKEAEMIVYIGGKKTEVYISDKKGEKLSSMIDFGRELFAASVNQDFLLLFLKDKIDEQYISWHTHEDQDKGNIRKKISRIILLGEIHNLENIADYLQVRLRIPVLVPNVWKKIIDFNEYIPAMTFEKSLHFSVAIGLAYREFTGRK